MSRSFQLTKHPVGSIREIWAISWPLMIGMISTSMMMFVDRLLLSWYSPLALNACANAGMAYWLCMVIPFSICAISEVLVGRLNGAGVFTEIGKPVWQMIWFSIFITPIFWVLAYILPTVLFNHTGNAEFEAAYLKPLMIFSPFLFISIALSGFFIGMGKVRVVTYSMLFANLFNCLIAYLLIFGWGWIPEMGVTGASIAAGLAQAFQVFYLLYFFLQKKNRQEFGTAEIGYDSKYLREGLRIGVPAGLGHATEVLAHFTFFQIIIMAGAEEMTIAAVVQSFYLLVSFMIDSESKGITAIASNLIGAREFNLTHTVFKSAIKLHTFFFAIVAGALMLFPQPFLSLFFSGEGSAVLSNPDFVQKAIQAMAWMSVFFLFDGFCWILVGLLTASGDTKFIFYVSSVINWVGYVLPLFLLISFSSYGNIATAWMVIAAYTMLVSAIYYWRYRSGRWLWPVLTPTETETNLAAEHPTKS